MAKKHRKQSRAAKLFSGASKVDTIATTYSYPSAPLPRMAEEEERLDHEFDETCKELARLWESLDVLARLLVEARAKLDDSTVHRSAIELLSAKSLTDARAAYLCIRRGYLLASLGILRSALEANDLITYLRLNPDEVELWRTEDAKFSSLGWIRKHLPVDPTPLYNFLAYGFHANWRFIPQLLSKDGTAATHFEVVPGPIRHPEYTELFALTSAHETIRALAELYNHSPVMVGVPWTDEYQRCMDTSERLLKDYSVRAKTRLGEIDALLSSSKA